MTEPGSGSESGVESHSVRATLISPGCGVDADSDRTGDTTFEAESAIDWLQTVETVDADDPVAGRGHLDFLLGAALAGVNLFVSAGIIAAWLLKTAGIVAVLVLNKTLSPDNPAAVELVIAGSLFGLALGVSGFAFFARHGWTSYYWPLFGITIALGSSVIAGRS